MLVGFSILSYIWYYTILYYIIVSYYIILGSVLATKPCSALPRRDPTLMFYDYMRHNRTYCSRVLFVGVVSGQSNLGKLTVLVRHITSSN